MRPRDERDAAIVALAMKGIRPRDICTKLSLTRNVVQVAMQRARNHGVAVPMFNGKPPRRPPMAQPVEPLPLEPVRVHAVDVPNITLVQLTPHATKRRISAVALASRIIRVVAESDLVNAVLDDGVR